MFIRTLGPEISITGPDIADPKKMKKMLTPPSHATVEPDSLASWCVR